ncbi:MAG: hypothetical protein MZV63_06850 [Marinilabiliales bacterium]|nr:hypothetical protein [Marinilabiliales bacterium]
MQYSVHSSSSRSASGTSYKPGDPRERLSALDRVVVLAVRSGVSFWMAAQGRAGGDVARRDQEFLPDLQGPIRLEAVQRQNPLHGDVIAHQRS